MYDKKIRNLYLGVSKLFGAYQIIPVFITNGCFWIIEVIFFWILLEHSEVKVFRANFFANSLIILVSFFLVSRLVFKSTGKRLKFLALIDLLYNFCSAAFFSFVIDFLSYKFNLFPPLVKILVSPIKFYAGYVQISWLVKGKPQFF